MKDLISSSVTCLDKSRLEKYLSQLGIDFDKTNFLNEFCSRLFAIKSFILRIILLVIWIVLTDLLFQLLHDCPELLGKTVAHFSDDRFRDFFVIGLGDAAGDAGKCIGVTAERHG